MEQFEPLRRISGALNKNVIDTPFLVIAALFCLYILPGFLIFLVPVIIVAYVRKLSTKASGASGTKPAKRKDPRRFWATLIVLIAGLAFLYLATYGVDFLWNLMIIGICTGGVIWIPLLAYLIAHFSLFVYDKITGNTTYTEIVPDTITASHVSPSAASVPTVTQAPTHAPDLSALSATDQSLVIYIAEASMRGVLGGEITLILKSTGWLDADIARGFELTSTYYPGVVK